MNFPVCSGAMTSSNIASLSEQVKRKQRFSYTHSDTGETNSDYGAVALALHCTLTKGICPCHTVVQSQRDIIG